MIFPRVTFRKQPDCVQELLQSAADPNIQNENGLTALMISVDHPDIDSVQYLVLNNADVSLKVRSQYRFTCLAYKFDIKGKLSWTGIPSG